MNLLLPILMLLLAAYPTEKATENKIQCDTPELMTAKGILFASDDAGVTWQDMSTGFPQDANPRAIWTSEDGLLVGTSHGLYRGTNSPITPMWRKDPFDQAWISGIFAGKAGPYLVSYSLGLFQYQKASGDWKNMHHALKDKNIHTVFETKDGKIFAGCDSGLYVSADRGASWEKRLSHQSVRTVLDMDGVLIAFTNHALMRSTDGGINWDRTLIDPGKAFYVGQIRGSLVVILEGQEFAGIRTPNEIMISPDQGATWQPMTGSLPASFASLYQLEEVGQYLFACSREGIYRSADRGKTWELVRKVPDDNKGNMYKLEVNDQTLFALLIDGC